MATIPHGSLRSWPDRARGIAEGVPALPVEAVATLGGRPAVLASDAASPHPVALLADWGALVPAALALVAAVAAGTVAHELSHAVVLRAAGVDCAIRWRPDEGETGLGSVAGRWATVVPRVDDVTPLQLRVAALSPLALALPVLAVAAGLGPGPTVAGDPMPAAVAVGWLACALPSPRDFSLVWYARAALDGADGGHDHGPGTTIDGVADGPQRADDGVADDPHHAADGVAERRTARRSE